MAILITIVSVTLGVSFLCSVMEACLLSLSTADIGRIAERRPVAAAVWKGFKRRIEQPITVILIINTLAHTIGASLSGAKFEEVFGSRWIVVYAIAFSLAMIQWTEILPKTLGVRYNRAVAAATAIPLRVLVGVMTPFISVVRFLNRPFEAKKQGTAPTPTEDISVLARFAALENLINKDQEHILSQTIRLSGMSAKDLMVPAEEARFLSTDMSMIDALIEAHIHHHTRYPLMRGSNRNDVVGYVNFKDIVSALQINPKDPSLEGIKRPMPEAREDEPVSALMGMLRRSYQHIAVVRDESGTVTGIVTLEDIIEALMGDIEDEYDILPSHVYQIAADRYVAGGGADLGVLRDKVCVALPPEPITVSDWIVSALKRPPKAEDSVRCGGCRFIVRKVRRSRVYEAIIDISGEAS